MPEIVVVGVGRSATARAALTWAADVAFRDPAPLRTVHVISHRSRDSTSTTQP